MRGTLHPVELLGRDLVEGLLGGLVAGVVDEDAGADVAIAATKFTAAAFTGGSAVVA